VTDNVYSPCESCRFAEWQRTTNGRRHPSGDGKCTFPFPDGPLPVYVVGSYAGIRKGDTVREVLERACGGRYISRHLKWLADDVCPCYEPLSGTKRADV
jgi:hypothetical protein